MARSFADETVETSNTTGTGTYTLEGPKGSYFPFSAAFASGDKPVYAVRNRQNTKVEYNRGAAFTTGSPATLARAVWKSTNGNAPVPWTADDLPLTIYIPSSAELHEGVVTGWLGAARHALLRAGAQFLTTVVASDVVKSWTHRLATSDSTDTRVGSYDVTADAYFGDGRRYFQDVGAASKTLDATDIGKVLLFDCTAAQRTATLLPSATAKHGFTVDILAYGSASNGVTLTPDGSDAIDVTSVPAGSRVGLEWDGAKSRWRVTSRTAAVQRNFISGLALSTAGSSSTFSIAAGRCADKTNVAMMVLGTALAKTTGAWTVGNNLGGLDTGTIANNTWYHAHLIQRVDTGVVDALVSLSATAPTLPTGYTLARRLGPIKTNGSGQWQKFYQEGDDFYIAEVSDFAPSSTSAATLRTLSIPTGIVVRPKMRAQGQGGSAAGSRVQVAPAADATLLATVFGVDIGQAITSSNIVTAWEGPASNTSGQINIAIPALQGSGSLTIYTTGWIDRRGQDD